MLLHEREREVKRQVTVEQKHEVISGVGKRREQGLQRPKRKNRNDENKVSTPFIQPQGVMVSPIYPPPQFLQFHELF